MSRKKWGREVVLESGKAPKFAPGQSQNVNVGGVGVGPSKKRVEIDYRPRKWAKGFHSAWARWYALVLHRRAGKTTAVINHHIRAAANAGWERERLRRLVPDISEEHMKELLRNRLYAHVLPLKTQAKLVAWTMLKYFASFVPGAKANENELRVDFANRARIQLFGADNIDALRGIPLSGLSMDEFGQHPPGAFGEVLSKALADHLGWCIWCGTIKGKNQLYKAYEAFKDDPQAYVLWQDIDESLRTEEDAATLMLKQAMADDRALISRGMMTEEDYQQEWYLSTVASIKGAYYTAQLSRARAEGRLTRVPYEPLLPVDTDWDLGMDDETVVWFSQSTRSGEVRLIDYYANSANTSAGGLAGLPLFAKMLREKPYTYGEHWAPHDIQVREMGTGKSRLEVAAGLGIHFKVVRKLPVQDGIDAVRLLLGRCWFDEGKCEAGVEALTQYRKSWNEARQEFTGEPVHDWASHAADGFRTLAVRHQGPVVEKEEKRGVYSGVFHVPGEHDWMR